MNVFTRRKAALVRTLLVIASCAWGAGTVQAASIALQSASRGFLGSQVAGAPDIQTYTSLNAADVLAGHRLDTSSSSTAGISIAWIDATAGGMHAYSDAQALAGSALAGNTAIVVDTLHVSSSTLALGTAVDLALTLQFSVSYQPDGPTNAMSVGVASFFSANDGVNSLSLFDDGPTLSNGWGQVPDRPFGILHTFVGADVTLDQRLQVNIQVDTSNVFGQHLVADASHSAHFFVNTAAPVQLLSQSGHDYAQRTTGGNVPEPGTAALALLAFGLLAAHMAVKRPGCGRAA
jgi:hypothetical protein